MISDIFGKSKTVELFLLSNKIENELVVRALDS